MRLSNAIASEDNQLRVFLYTNVGSDKVERFVVTDEEAGAKVEELMDDDLVDNVEGIPVTSAGLRDFMTKTKDMTRQQLEDIEFCKAL